MNDFLLISACWLSFFIMSMFSCGGENIDIFDMYDFLLISACWLSFFIMSMITCGVENIDICL